MAEKIIGIYKIENLINHKKYIGQASDITWRWTHHKSDLNNNRHHNKHLQNAWNKYGQYNFEFTILEQCSIDELNKRESYWINKLDSYNTGYNLDLGGQGIRGYKHTTDEINKMHRIQNPKIVLQFDLNFNLIKEWIGGVSHVCKEMGYTKECILLRCKHSILNKMTPYKNSYWIYKEEYTSNDFSWESYFNNVRKSEEKPIYQYDKKFNLLKIWNNHYDLREAGYSTYSILRICNQSGTQRIYKDSIWCYEGYDFSDGYFGFKSEYKKGQHCCRKVGMKLEKDGEIIKSFDSVTDACKYLNRPIKFRNNIVQSISKNQKSANYYWEYLD